MNLRERAAAAYVQSEAIWSAKNQLRFKEELSRTLGIVIEVELDQREIEIEGLTFGYMLDGQNQKLHVKAPDDSWWPILSLATLGDALLAFSTWSDPV